MNLQDKSNFCEECGKNVSGGKKGLESHHKRYHKSVICPTCGVEVKGWEKFHAHKRLCEKRTCEKCLKEISRNHFSKHSKACNGEGDGQYSCDQCDYKTDHQSNLKR